MNMEATTELKNTGTPLAALLPTDSAYLVLSEKHNEQALVELAGKYVDVTEIKDVTDYRLVMRGGIELMKARTAIEATGKAARDDANQFRKAIIAEERRLILITLSEESRLKALRKDYDDEQARIAEEARLVEQRRIADITERIQAIKKMTDGLLGADSTALQMRLDAVNTIVCNETLFAEFAEQAAEVKAGVVETLNMLLEARQELESQMEENQRVAQEQAERQAKLDQQAKEQAARERAVQDKIDAERQENDRKEAARQAEIDRRLELIAEAEARIEAERKAEEEKKLSAERAEAARVQAENDRLEREKREAEEAAHQEAIKPEKERLMEWAEYLDGMHGPDVSDEQLKTLRNAAEMIVSKTGSDLMRVLNE